METKNEAVWLKMKCGCYFLINFCHNSDLELYFSSCNKSSAIFCWNEYDFYSWHAQNS